MSKTKKAICIFFSFVCAALVGSVLYGEKLSHENTKKELQEIVLQDIQKTEVFLEQNPDSMEQWADYLAIDQAKKAIDQPSEDSNNDLISLMMALKFTNGVTKYPVFVNLRESLGALLDWRKSNFLQTAFQNQRILASLASSRTSRAETAVGIALTNPGLDLRQDQKNHLEKEFQDRVQGDLPCAMPEPPFSGSLTEMKALSKQDITPNVEQSNQEKAPKHRRSMLYDKLQQTHGEDETSETSAESEEMDDQPEVQNSRGSSESSLQNGTLSGSNDSKPFILAETPSLTEFMTYEEEVRSKPFLNASFCQGLSSCPCVIDPK